MGERESAGCKLCIFHGYLTLAIKVLNCKWKRITFDRMWDRERRRRQRWRKKLWRTKYGCQDLVNEAAPEAELKNNELIKTVIIVVSVCIGNVCFRGAFAFFSFVQSPFISFYVPWILFFSDGWPLRIIAAFFSVAFARTKLMIFLLDEFYAHRRRIRCNYCERT